MAEHYYYSIASGSSGNCGLYMADGTAILIDLYDLFLCESDHFRDLR